MLSTKWLTSIIDNVIHCPPLWLKPQEGWLAWSQKHTGVNVRAGTIAGRIVVNDAPAMMHGALLGRALDGEVEGWLRPYMPDVYTRSQALGAKDIGQLDALIEETRANDMSVLNACVELPQILVAEAKLIEVALLSLNARKVRLEFEAGKSLPLTPWGGTEIYLHFIPVMSKSQEDGVYFFGHGNQRRKHKSGSNSAALQYARKKWYFPLREREVEWVRAQANRSFEDMNLLEVEMAQIFLETDKLLVSRDARTLAQLNMSHGNYAFGIAPYFFFVTNITAPPVAKIVVWGAKTSPSDIRLLFYPGVMDRLRDKYKRRGGGVMGYTVEKSDQDYQFWRIKKQGQVRAKIALRLPHKIEYQARNSAIESYKVPPDLVKMLHPEDFVAWAVWHTAQH